MRCDVDAFDLKECGEKGICVWLGSCYMDSVILEWYGVTWSGDAGVIWILLT